MTQPLQSAYSGATSLYGDQAGAMQSAGLNEGSYNSYSPLNDTENLGLGNLSSAGSLESSLGTYLAGLGSSGSAGLSSALQSLQAGSVGNFNQGTTAAGSAAMDNAGAYSTLGSGALSSAYGQASTDPTQQNIADASSYMNNSQTQAMIDAETKAANLKYAETQTPQLNADAIAGGNLNSSRAGAAQAISDTNQQASNQANATSILNNAYNTGLSTAEQGRESNLNGLLSTASGAQAGSSLGLAGQTANNDQTNANNNTVLNYLQQLQNASTAATSTGTTGAQLASTGGQDTYGAGQVQQQNAEDAKTGATDALANYQAAQETPLANLMSVIGNSNAGWGGTSSSNSTTTQKTTDSIMSQILSGVGGAAGLLTKFGVIK